MKKLFLAVLLSSVAFGCLSCGPAEPEIRIGEAWGRISPKSAANAAFYMEIQNDGSAADRLIGAESPHCGKTQIHETRIDERGVASMQHIEEIDIPASSTIMFEIGGLHVMCLDKQKEFTAGIRIPVTLVFQKSGEIIIEAEIREE